MFESDLEALRDDLVEALDPLFRSIEVVERAIGELKWKYRILM